MRTRSTLAYWAGILPVVSRDRSLPMDSTWTVWRWAGEYCGLMIPWSTSNHASVREIWSISSWRWAMMTMRRPSWVAEAEIAENVTVFPNAVGATNSTRRYWPNASRMKIGRAHV